MGLARFHFDAVIPDGSGSFVPGDGPDASMSEAGPGDMSFLHDQTERGLVAESPYLWFVERAGGEEEGAYDDEEDEDEDDESSPITGDRVTLETHRGGSPDIEVHRTTLADYYRTHIAEMRSVCRYAIANRGLVRSSFVL